MRPVWLARRGSEVSIFYFDYRCRSTAHRLPHCERQEQDRTAAQLREERSTALYRSRTAGFLAPRQPLITTHQFVYYKDAFFLF